MEKKVQMSIPFIKNKASNKNKLLTKHGKYVDEIREF